MTNQGAARAMIQGGSIGFFVYLVLISLAALFPPIGESFIGKMLGECPVPERLLDILTVSLFGSSTSEGGILVFLVMACVEAVIAGGLIGLLYFSVKQQIVRHGGVGRNA